MPYFIFKIFPGQLRAAGNSTLGPSEAEELISLSKSRLPPGKIDPIQKKFISIYSRPGNVSQGLHLSTFKKNLHLWKTGAYQ